MVSAKEDNLVYGFRLSSVGSGKITEPTDMVHDPKGIDLAMKLHYLRGVYFFSSEAAPELTVEKMKVKMFEWLVPYTRLLGRFRRSESGRPCLKCNDCGARFIEAWSDKTLEEWLGMDWSFHKLLFSNQIIGPELLFSPLILFQWTRFKCGGVAIGLSWSHILGDAMAASDFFNGLSRTMAGKGPLSYPVTSKPNVQQKLKHPSPRALKKVESVGDHWITANNHKMETFSFSITPTQLNILKQKVTGQEIPTFELICGVIWQCVAKVREGSEPKLVTICRSGPKRPADEYGNCQIISTVEAAADVADADPKTLAAMLAKQDEKSYEQSRIGEVVESDNGVSDYIVYGANLTFVNWEDSDFYGFEVIGGHKPVSVNYAMQGVGDEGAVMVMPGPNGEGRVVNIIVPEKEVPRLKDGLRKNDVMLDISIRV